MFGKASLLACAFCVGVCVLSVSSAIADATPVMDSRVDLLPSFPPGAETYPPLDDRLDFGWAGAGLSGNGTGSATHSGSKNTAGDLIRYDFEYDAAASVGSNGSLHGDSSIKAEGVFDLQYSMGTISTHHKYILFDPETDATRAHVQVRVSFDGNLRAFDFSNNQDEEGKYYQFAKTSASARVYALATYLDYDYNPEDIGGPIIVDPGSDNGGDGLPIPPGGTPPLEAWAEGSASVSIAATDGFVYSGGGTLFDDDGFDPIMSVDSLNGEMEISGNVDSSAIFEFYVEDLSYIVDLEVSLWTSASVTGKGGSMVGGENQSTYFHALADSDFSHTGTFSIESIVDPITGQSIDFTLVVPEPATLSLLALGGLAVLRRRK